MVNDRFQFSLRQLLIGIAVLAALLSAGRWFYLNYVYAHPITAEDDLEEYVGRVVTFRCTVHEGHAHKELSVVTLGDKRIACDEGEVHIRPKNGQTITVEGRLTRAVYPYAFTRYHISLYEWRD